ncbi:MAG: holo-[acyl-carrier-protein] synthase [Chloroflexota bacterium]
MTDDNGRRRGEAAPRPYRLTTGVDLIEIARIEAAIARFGDRFLQRIYTPAELAYCRGRASELAARFAAKEAVAKALGVGLAFMAADGVGCREIEVLSDERGKPTVVLHGRARARAEALKLRDWSLSLSHARDIAIAFVVASS